MLFATYQPKEPQSSRQDPRYDCFRDKLGGEYPVFCFPARTADEFRFRSLLAAPCKPECLIFFDTNEYVRFDAVTWNNILTLPRDVDFDGKFAAMFDDVDERFSEYVVPQSRLKKKIEVIDIKQLIEKDTFGCKTQDGEVSEAGARVVEYSQNLVRQEMHDILSSGNWESECNGNDMTAILYQTMFVTFLGGFIWNVVNEKVNSVVDFIPFICDKDDKTSRDEWDSFNELRKKIFDTAMGGTHEDYIMMCEALARAVGLNREGWLSKFKRNDPCPCGSGKKLKKCHGLKPIELFPF